MGAHSQACWRTAARCPFHVWWRSSSRCARRSRPHTIAESFTAISSRQISGLSPILSEATGQPMDRIKHDTDRDIYMTADEAKAYGLVDELLAKPEGR